MHAPTTSIFHSSLFNQDRALKSQPLQSTVATPDVQPFLTSLSATSLSPLSLTSLSASLSIKPSTAQLSMSRESAFVDSTSQPLSHRLSLSRDSSPPFRPPLRQTTSTLASPAVLSSDCFEQKIMGIRGVVFWCFYFFVTVWWVLDCHVAVGAARLGALWSNRTIGMDTGHEDQNTTVAAYGGYGNGGGRGYGYGTGGGRGYRSRNRGGYGRRGGGRGQGRRIGGSSGGGSGSGSSNWGGSYGSRGGFAGGTGGLGSRAGSGSVYGNFGGSGGGDGAGNGYGVGGPKD
ncbi:hypothetical protein E3N88_39216 [Mikania micrantha]|uniref:Uncharacterized protein n=1 Tax=Mikania micrantha TaxID=192012 RepID=A0A5N6LW59_9ASTR|nr:hypothetical protein E3N88_39216 [Mikania micrantha]